MADHFNAEVVAGTVSTRQDAVDYLTWTFFYRRLVQNPSYYGLEGVEAAAVNQHLSGLVEEALGALQAAGGCVCLGGGGRALCWACGGLRGRGWGRQVGSMGMPPTTDQQE